MEDDDIKEAQVSAFETQLSAISRMQQKSMKKTERKTVGMSQIDMVEDILQVSGESLHIGEIIEHVEKKHGVSLERDSIVNELTKKVTQKDRFVCTAKHTFGLREGN